MKRKKILIMALILIRVLHQGSRMKENKRWMQKRKLSYLNRRKKIWQFVK